MIEETIDHINKRIRSARVIWVYTPAHVSLDQVCASVVFARLLARTGKEVGLVMPPNLDSRIAELVPETKDVPFPASPFGTTLVVNRPELDASRVTVQSEEGGVSVVFPGTLFTEQSVRVKQWQKLCDVAIVIGAHNRQSFFGEGFEPYARALGEVPVILLGFHITTEAWGELNCIDPKASGASELVERVARNIFPGIVFEPREATLLYMGIVDATHGFSVRNQNPKTYEAVSRLIEYGADNAKIINEFYFSKRLSELRVWGRALARLERDAYRNIVWSRVAAADFEKTGATPAEARTVLDEMMVQAPEADVACLFLEHEGRTEVGIRNKLGGFPLAETFWKYSPLGGNDRLVFMISAPLVEAERMILEELTFAWDRLRPR